MTAPIKVRPIDVRIECRASVDVVDLPQIIRDHMKEYQGTQLQGHEEWERPSVFLWDYIAECLLFAAPGGGPFQRSYEDDPEIDFRWTREDWQTLIAECPEADLETNPPPPVADDRTPQPWDVPLPLEVRP